MQFLPSSILKTLFLTTLAAFVSSNAEARPRIRPVCQVKLLKVATDALEREYPPKDSAIGVITEIVYNYNLEGLPRVIFLARSAYNADETCIIDVRTMAPADTEETCPDYKFSEIRTTCK